jgi:hypothetical protein
MAVATFDSLGLNFYLFLPFSHYVIYFLSLKIFFLRQAAEAIHNSVQTYQNGYFRSFFWVGLVGILQRDTQTERWTVRFGSFGWPRGHPYSAPRPHVCLGRTVRLT